MADLMDPVALEARLKDARLRRAKVLAQREAELPAKPPACQNDSQSERTIPRPPPAPAARAVSLGPKRPGWLDDISRNKAAEPAGAAGFQAPDSIPEPAGPTTRLRPVLLAPAGGPARKAHHPASEHPPFGAEGEAESPLLAALRTATPRSRRRMTPAALLFVAGLGIGATIVAMVVSPADSDPEQIATASVGTDTPEPAIAPEPVAPGVASAPAAVAEPPVAHGPAAATPRTAAPATEPSAPASLAVPVSEPAPPPMAPPGPAIDEIIDAASPTLAEPETMVPPEFASSDELTPGIVAGPLPERISIHYPRSAQGAATSIQAQLRAAGVADVEIMPVGLAIGHSNVRFYHDADREGAEGASALIADALGGAPETRDFTDYPTPTVTGRIEIWLAGEPGRGGSTSGNAASTTAPAPTANVSEPDPYALLAPNEQVREVQRILLDRMSGNP